MFEPLQHSYAATFCWGFVLIVSWIGAGSLVRAVLRTRPQQHVDWGLLAGWGLAAHAAVGGALMLLGLAHRPVLFGLVLITAVYQGVVWAIRPRDAASPDPDPARVSMRWRWVFVALVALPLVLNYASQVSRRAGAWTDNDDYVAYLPFLQRIFDTGSLIEPFNMRRLAAYGGHSLLQAESIVLGSGRHAILLERGIGPILIAGLLWGIFRPRTVFQFVVASGLTVALALFPLPRANSHAN